MPESLVGYGHHNGLIYVVNALEHLLDLFGLDVFSARHEHVVEPPFNVQPPILVESPYVSSVEPPVGITRIFNCSSRHIALKQRVSSNKDLPVVCDAQLPMGKQSAIGSQAFT